MNHEADIARLTATVEHLREASAALAATTVERARCDERDRARSAVLTGIAKRLDEFDRRLETIDRRLDTLEAQAVRCSDVEARVTKIESDRRSAGVARLGFAGTVITAILAAVAAWLTASRR